LRNCHHRPASMLQNSPLHSGNNPSLAGGVAGKRLMAMTCARGYRKRDKIVLAHGAYHGTQPWAGTNPIGFLPSDRADVIMVPWGDPDAFGRVVEENIIRLDFLLGSVFPV